MAYKILVNVFITNILLQIDTLVICCKTSLNEMVIPKDAFTGASYKLPTSTTTTILTDAGTVYYFTFYICKIYLNYYCWTGTWVS